MTGYELLSLLVAVIAVGISAVSLIRTGTLQRQQLRLNKVSEELSRKQLGLLASREVTSQQARVIAALEGFSSNWWFILTNEGPAVARDVDLELLGCPESPLVKGDYDRKLPVPLLQPGQQLRLIAAIHMGGPTTFAARVTWTNTDGARASDDYFLSI